MLARPLSFGELFKARELILTSSAREGATHALYQLC